LNASATAVAANYRSSSRARSRREFISKLAVAVEEADESVGWLEVVTRAGLDVSDRSRDLLREARELLAILAASRRTAERNRPERNG
jgi:four helix bundle protein